jgi:hypothetical protein
MFENQIELDQCLDRVHTLQVHICQDHALPINNHSYDPIRSIERTGFVFTPRELLHAIGSKLSSLPSTIQDECIKNAIFLLKNLNLDSDPISIKISSSSDIQGLISQLLGIGFMCLISNRYFNIPWDQLSSLPAPGKRFDYRGSRLGLDGIFEAKGTSSLSTQQTQIQSGISKKEAHHQRHEFFDIELIVATCIGRNSSISQIILADPDESSLSDLYRKGNDRYFRLKHYCRVLQYIGLPKSAYHLNRYALDYLHNRINLQKTIMDEKAEFGFLTTITVNDDEFVGRWFTSWLPENSNKYKKQKYEKEANLLVKGEINFRVFQGVRRDIYRSGFDNDPFTLKLLTDQETKKYTNYGDSRVSAFPDGTILIFEHY